MASDRSPLPPESPFLADTTATNGHGMDQANLGRGDRAGLMIIRAWVEEGSPEPLRVQVRHTTDVSKGFQRTVNLCDVEDAAAAVAGWLADIMAQRGDPPE